MKTLTSALALALVSFPLAAQAPADVASPNAIVNATYASLERAPGDDYDWSRFESLFLPTAILIPSEEQTGGELAVLSPADFRAWIQSATTIGGSGDLGFEEYVIHNEVDEFGDVAQVFSSYGKRWYRGEDSLGRGINSFNLILRDGRWWIASIVWDEEVGAGPIPSKYLGGED